MSIEDAKSPSTPEQTASEQWGSWGPTNGGMPAPAPLAPPPPPIQPQPQSSGAIASSPYPYAEYASGSPPPVPPYGAYALPYGYPAGVPPAQGGSDGYLTGIAITALVCSIVAILAGLFWLFTFLITLTATTALPSSSSGTPSAIVGALVITIVLLTFTLASFVGGGFTLYHSIRALMRKPSAIFRLPDFWVFLVLYIAVLGVEYALYSGGQDLASSGLILLVIALLVLAAALPAFSLIALGLWRLRPLQATFTWRRMLVAFASGITFTVSMALYMEYTAIVQLFSTSFNQSSYSQCLVTPTLPECQNLNSQGLAPLLTNVGLLAAIVAIPLIDEFTKPLLIVAFMGKVRSAAEAFAMGLVCGAGFGLIEALFLVGVVYNNWTALTLITNSLVIVQGFGAAMGTLGWYYMTRTKTHRARNAIACWACALLQHVFINALLVSSLLPDPIGSTIKGWSLNLGTQSIPANVLAYTIGVILILALFIYIAGRLRKQPVVPSAADNVQ